MHSSSTHLEDKIHSLEKEFGELGQQLETAIHALRYYGELPPEEVVRQFEETQKAFMGLRNSLIQLAQRIAGARMALSEKPDRFQKIKEVLARVQKISHKEKPDFPPLRECQAMALQLSRYIEQPGVKFDGIDEAFAKKVHSFFDLLMLLEQGHSIEDAAWQKLQDSITRNFGEVLTLAAVRGKLQLPQGDHPMTTSGDPFAGSIPREIRTGLADQVQITTIISSSSAGATRLPVEEAPKPIPSVEPKTPPSHEEPEKPSSAPLVRPVKSAPNRRSIRNELIRVLKNSGDVPAFSPTTQKLLELTNRQFVNFKEISDIVKLDPGLTARYLRLANSPSFGGQDNPDIVQALFRLGFVELRKLAMSVEILKHFSQFRVPVDWNQFWLHSLLSSRLAGILVNLFHATDEKEHVSGLLHDIGKLFLGHYFPDQFEEVITHVSKTNCAFYEAEKEILDITHSEIGGMLCEKWRLGAEIAQSVRYHHELDELIQKFPDTNHLQIRTVCIHVASGLANSHGANIQGGKAIALEGFESSPEWDLLRRFSPKTKLNLDLNAELQKARDSMQALAAAAKV